MIEPIGSFMSEKKGKRIDQKQKESHDTTFPLYSSGLTSYSKDSTPTVSNCQEATTKGSEVGPLEIGKWSFGDK